MNGTRANTELPSRHDAGASARPARCRNCGADAPGAYCPACGQETRVALPTVRELMRDAAGRLVAFDSRLWRTLFILLFRPGMLTLEYLQGRRKRYVRPARLFFVMSLLLFAAIRLFVPPTQIIVIDLSEDKPATAPPPGASAAHEEIARVDPDWDRLVARVGRYMSSDMRKRIEHFKYLSQEEQMDQVYSGLMRYAPYGLVVLLPAFAFLQYIAYLPRRRRHPQRPSHYAEHLVYGAHLHAFAFLMIIAMVIMPVKIVEVAVGVWVLVYVSRARLKVYGGTWLGGLLRSVFVALVYLVLLGLAMSALLALSIATR